jgi:predicted nucleic acid-binding protein
MESALIISNTTPLINFAEIGRMDVLEALFGSITIPPAVAG